MLLQKARNEAHRFGITFHRNKRSSVSLNSSLTNIEGIGPATVQKLLREFKSLSGIKNAAPADIEKMIGKTKAERVLLHLKVESIK